MPKRGLESRDTYTSFDFILRNTFGSLAPKRIAPGNVARPFVRAFLSVESGIVDW